MLQPTKEIIDFLRVLTYNIIVHTINQMERRG